MPGPVRSIAVAALLAGCLATLAPGTEARAETSLGIEQIGRIGAPGLALRLIDSSQPDPEADPAGWFAWERQRIATLAQWKQWRRGLARLAELAPSASPSIQSWAATQRGWFHLELGETEQAREVLRVLLWSNPQAIRDQRRVWRQLVVRSYLIEESFADALTAMQRYQLDYRDNHPRWRTLQARVLLSTGRGRGVDAALEGLDTDEADALRSLGRLHAGTESAEKVFKSARTRATESKDPRVRARFWSVAAQAGDVMESSSRVALATDQGLRHAHALSADDRLFTLQADDLWSAYLRYGRLVGNNVQLLVGSDTAWLEEAEKSLPLTPIRARALLSVVAMDGVQPQSREAAHGRIAELLAAERGGFRVMQALYLDSGRFPEPVDIPVNVRYRLADHALSRTDIELATRVMAELDQPPQGADAFNWQLRRARVLIMGGRAEQGAKALNLVVSGEDVTLSRVQLDRYMQVVFDLQAVGAHREAIALFDKIAALDITPERHREILFWQADSWKQLEEYNRAAYYYLRSATLLDPKAADPWAQTARYNAAEVLADAGLVDDARRLYAGLLRTTKDPDRTSVLRHRLQQLWLQEATTDNVPARR